MEKDIDVSVIIPAYNEEKRLGPFLDELVQYVADSSLAYEIIVVDDFSGDGTVALAESYEDRFSCFRLISSERNRGKGFSVKRGLLSARGDYSLFMDADGSVEPMEIERNLKYVREGECDILIGSRVLRDEKQVLATRWYRVLLGKVFNFLVKQFLFRDIKDTQCGFKIFRRDVVEPVLSRVGIEGFGFDMELLYVARKLGFRILEVPVSWHHVDGAKVNLFRDSLGMFFNILQVRKNHSDPD